MTSCETRTVLARIDPDLMPLADFRDEGLRLAAFRYSATVVAGQRCDYKRPSDPSHEAHYA